MNSITWLQKNCSEYVLLHKHHFTLKQIKHICDNCITNMILIIEHVFDCIIQNCIGLHIVIGTLGNGIFFSIQYITQYIQLQNKHVLLSTTRKIIPTNYDYLHLSNSYTCEYFFVLLEPHIMITKLKRVYVF